MSQMKKHGFQVIEEDQATGDLLELYERSKRMYQSPVVFNLTKAIGMSEAALKFQIDMTTSFYGNMTLPQSLTALIFFTVAQKSDCEYCTAAHEVTCRMLGVDEATLTAIAENLGELNPERIRAIIEFALKAAKYPQSLKPEDYEKLRDMGISNDEIVQIVTVAGVAVYLDIMADALKVEVDESLTEALGK